MVELEEGGVLYDEGDAAESAFLIQSGRIRLAKRIRDEDQSISLLREGDILGVEALAGLPTRTARATAMGPTEALPIDLAALLEQAQKDAGVTLQRLARQLLAYEEQLENAALRDAPSRVVNSLLRALSAQEKRPSGTPVTLEMSPLELASRVGLDIDIVRKSIKQLSASGYLSFEDEQLVVKDMRNLKRLYHLLGVKEQTRRGYF